MAMTSGILPACTGQGCCSSSYKAQGSPTKKNYPAQNVSSTGSETLLQKEAQRKLGQQVGALTAETRRGQRASRSSRRGPKYPSSFLKNFYFVLGYSQLTNNVVTVSGEQQRDQPSEKLVPCTYEPMVSETVSHSVVSSCL